MNDPTLPATDLPTDDGAAPVERSHLPFPVVGIGASAGCVDALLRLFGPMPARPGMAFVVVVHLSPQHESSIDSILGRVTPMPVLQVRERVAIEPDHVYVISPALQLAMTDGHLEVTPLDASRHRHVAIDVFFRTLAEAQRERAFGIVLSGTGADGSVGFRRLKEMGGITLVQAPNDAEYDGMPNSAIASGAADFVLPAPEMAGRLVELWDNVQRIALPGLDGDAAPAEPTKPDPRQLDEAALAEILLLLRSRTGHDFKHYKRATVLRRLERRLQVNALPTLTEYAEFLRDNPHETSALLKDLLISVTNFFRDREAFESLHRAVETTIFGQAHPRARLRAWVAGCATGEEAYSVAMLLVEQAAATRPGTQIQVFATDIDEHAIAIGRTGLYPDAIVADVSPSRLREYFSREDGHVRLRKPLREKVLFAVHNLLRDPPFSNLDLICCRNLLIYLDREVQVQVLQLFHFALNPGGLLFLGSSESADTAGDLFVPVDKKNRIYRSLATPQKRRPQPLLPPHARIELPSIWQSPSEQRSTLADLHERILGLHAPASVLIDGLQNILHSTSRAGPFLRFAAGAPSQNLLDAVHPDLRVDLRTTLYRAALEGRSVASREVRFGGKEPPVWLTIRAMPVADPGTPFTLVVFDQAEVTLGSGAEQAGERDPVFAALESELQRTREQLRGSLGESAASSEELRASNEELQAANEELRSMTEELETSKEELQSINEELVTVNHELKAKVEDTGKLNDDLKNLIASTDIATVFVDRAMRIKRYTPKASQLFNLIATDVGRSLLDITHRLDYPELEDDATRTFQSLQPIEREVTGEDQRSYLVRVLPYRTHEDVIDGAVLSFIDVSILRQAQEQLRIGDANLRMVIETSRDYAFVVCDAAGVVTGWNEGAQRTWGYAEVEILGQPFERLFTPDDRASGLPAAELRRARELGRTSDERWHVGKDGRRFYCSGITTPLYNRGKLIGYAKIARDLSDAKHAENQLETLLRQEKQTRAELQHAITLKDEFLAVMSHELKHPLNLIHVNAELLSRLPHVRDMPAVARATDVIRRTVLGQAKIIDDLLDLSRMHTGKLTLNPTPMEWLPVVAQVLDAAAEDARARGIALVRTLEPAASNVQADPVRAEQIVWNLVSNALKFTPRDGRVEVRLAVDGELSRLDVIDSGQGIDADFIEHVFDMFRQADRTTTRPQGGMGIGLALVKQLAEEHGGRVAVASAGLGRGARFSVWLPLAGPDADAAVGLATVPVLGSLSILVVDDTEDALSSFAMLLRLEGATVTACANGREALEAAALADFDLLLSDIAMPVMDGYQLIAALRAAPRTAALPAVALTGFGRVEDARRAIEAGFDAHLAKPVVIDELLQTVKRLPRLRR